MAIDVQLSKRTLGQTPSTLGIEKSHCPGGHQGRLPGDSDTGVGEGDGVKGGDQEDREGCWRWGVGHRLGRAAGTLGAYGRP